MIFCGSKKTLALGVPMAKLIFGAHPGLGLILLPIMIYYPLQLMVGGVLAQRWGREARYSQGHRRESGAATTSSAGSSTARRGRRKGNCEEFPLASGRLFSC